MLETTQLNKVSEVLKAIAHPVRIGILELLTKDQKLSVTQIYEQLNIEQAAASHHLNILKNKDVLVAERVGKNCYYSLKYQELTQIIDCITDCQL